MFYQYLIDSVSTNNIEKCTEYIYNKYNTNEEIKNLLYPIKNIPEIPIELLSKYYAKLYTIECQFYVDINRELREKQRKKYLSYIKLLYEGVRLESLPITSNNEILYRGSKISNDEVIKIKKYLKNKIKDLPGAIVFSRSFLSFTKDKKIAEGFLNNTNDD